jgi:competence protein ComEC
VAARWTLPAALAGTVAGILARDLSIGVPETVLAAGALAAGLAALVWRTGAGVMLAAALLGVAIGAWRQEAAQPLVGPTGASVLSLVDGEEHDLVGTVRDDPRPRGERLQLVLDAAMASSASGTTSALAGRVLVWMPRGIDATSGDLLRIRARLELPEDFDGFAYREYLARQGIDVIARARSVEGMLPGQGPVTWLAGVRSALLDGLNRLVPEPEAALGAGILLGVRAAIAPEVDEAFAAAGLTHVVAISGWNIAIVVGLVTAALRPLERRPGGRWTTTLIAAMAVTAYVLLTGASPSVVRAALMAAAMVVARMSGSRAHAASALGLAALIMLLAAPSVLWDVGFQLSLLATAGLIWFGASIERRLRHWPGWIREPVALTLAAQLTTLPVILVNFERLSLVAPIANVLVVPIVPFAMLGAAVASVAGVVDGALPVPLVGEAATWLAGGVAWIVLASMIALGTAVASVPFATLEVAVPPVVAAAWLPVLGLAAWALSGGTSPLDAGAPASQPGRLLRIVRRVARPIPVAAGVALLLAAATVGTLPDGRLHLTVLDVGQGDAILVEAPDGATMLVDGGPDPERTLRRLGANLPFHRRRIDLVVLTHPHQDHVAGLVEAHGRFRVGAVLHAGIGFDNPAFNRLLADAGSAGTAVAMARAGTTLALGRSTTVAVLYPADVDARSPLPEGDINNGSVVLTLRHGGFSALLTGDAEAPVEATLVRRGAVPPVDVLKVGHHGSTSSTTAALLDAARPAVAIISAGEDNEYGHPAPETLAALAGRPGLAILRTDLHGDVEVETDGRAFRVRTAAGWTGPRPVHGTAVAGSIGPWLSPTEQPCADSSTTSACPPGSSSTARAWPGWRSRRRAWWRKPESPSTRGSSRRPPSSTTSTSRRSGGPQASTASPARGGSRRWGTPSSPCRSPPTRSTPCSTMTASRSAGRRSSWPSPTGTWHRCSSPSTSGSTT